MTAWLSGFWAAVWPNLAANLVWLPAVWGWVEYRDIQVRRHHGETLRQAIRDEFADLKQTLDDVI